MAVLVKNLDYYVGATAQFQTWGKAISDALAAMGLVKTSDTGQIDWLTVAAPIAADQMMGYEVWRFADALQATSPVFFKIAYGSGYQAASGSRPPGFQITVGTSTNGAGTLLINGLVQGAFRCRSNWQTSPPIGAGNFANMYVSGNSARATIANNFATGGQWGAGSSERPFGFNIERTKDNIGDDTTDGFCVNTFEGWASNSGAAGVVYQIMVPFTGPPPPAEVGGGALGMNSNFGVNNNIDVYISPIFPIRGRLLNPIIGFLAYQQNDMQSQVPVPISMYGVNHTYLPLGPNTAPTVANTGLNSIARGGVGSAVAMLWE